MDKLHSKVELCANIAIIFVALLLAVILIKPFTVSPATSSTDSSFKEIAVGEKISLEGMEWEKSQRTLLLVISQGCHYCTESAPFYKRLAEEAATRKGVKLIAILPQEVNEAEKYLGELDIPVSETKQASLGSIRVKGTPTLVLVDNSGTVINKWLGKVPPEVELEVLKQMRCDTCGS